MKKHTKNCQMSVSSLLPSVGISNFATESARKSSPHGPAIVSNNLESFSGIPKKLYLQFFTCKWVFVVGPLR